MPTENAIINIPFDTTDADDNPVKGYYLIKIFNLTQPSNPAGTLTTYIEGEEPTTVDLVMSFTPPGNHG